MPVVRIDLLRGRPDDELAAIASCVHEAMVAELGVPERDRFQILTQHEPGELAFNREYLGFERGDGWLLVQVTLSAGRSTEAKQAFYARVSRRLGELIGLPEDDVAVVLVENQREDWSFGGGQASYLTLPPEAWR